MTDTSMAVELFDPSRRYRRQEATRQRRKKQARVTILAGVVTTAALGLGLAVAAVLSDGEQVSAQPNDTVDAQVAAPAPPPLPPATVAVTVTTAPPHTPWPIELPTGKIDGWLFTDGVYSPRLVPGQVGQSVITLPVDRATLFNTSRFNTGEGAEKRSWQVFERRDLASEDDIARALAAEPVVPTVLLVSDLPSMPRPSVVAR